MRKGHKLTGDEGQKGAKSDIKRPNALCGVL